MTAQQGPSKTCESCGNRADVMLPDKSWWCRSCDTAAERMGYPDGHPTLEAVDR